MMPSINDGDKCLVLRIFNKISRGDVIVLVAPSDKKQNYIKRVIGLPGEVIKIHHGRVSVDGEKLIEDYINSDYNPRVYTIRVPAHSYCVLGDNRGDSHDSRNFGTISEDLVVGVAIYRWWPFCNAGTLSKEHK